MQITDDKWNAIITEVRQGIDRWNARAAEHKKGDTFRYELVPAGEYVLLLTTHRSGSTEWHSVAYKPVTQEMWAAKLIFKNGRVTGFRVKPDPKAWTSLATKPAAEIVKRLKLTDFLIIDNVHAVRPPSGPPLYLVRGFYRQDHQRHVAMVVAGEEGVMIDVHAIAERIAGPDFCFPTSGTIGVQVAPEYQGVLFDGDEQLYAKVPELRPHDLRRRGT
jgi:hypothetical protein